MSSAFRSGAASPITNEVVYKDLGLTFTAHPITKNVKVLKNDEAVKRAVKNLILTNKYERPFNSDFGCNLRGYLFENITPPLMVAIKDRVATAIEAYEPRVSVEDIVVSEDGTNNGINIMVSFRIKGVQEPVTVTTFLQRVR